MAPTHDAMAHLARRTGSTLRAASLVALLAHLGCAGPGAFVPVERLPVQSDPDDEYRIATGDLLAVRVWNQESMSMDRTRVREDGRISVPFLQDVDARGRTAAELGVVLKARLLAFMVNPVVTVTLEEPRPLRVPVAGEVTRPGVYEVDRRAGVLTALAAAGGLTEFAHRDAIYVLRHQVAVGEPSPLRVRFAWASLIRGEHAAATFRLRDGDVVVAE